MSEFIIENGVVIEKKEKKIMSKKIYMILMAVVIAFGGMIPSVSVEARTSSGRCIYNSCNNPCYGQSVYCKNHDFTYQMSHQKCCHKGCYKYTEAGCGSYCSEHDPCKKKTPTTARAKVTSTKSYTKKNTTNTTNKTKSNSKYTSKKSKINSYDKGYEDMYEDFDYDERRYRTDWDYALGVDDAMEEMGE